MVCLCGWLEKKGGDEERETILVFGIKRMENLGNRYVTKIAFHKTTNLMLCQNSFCKAI